MKAKSRLRSKINALICNPNRDGGSGYESSRFDIFDTFWQVFFFKERSICNYRLLPTFMMLEIEFECWILTIPSYLYQQEWLNNRTVKTVETVCFKRYTYSSNIWIDILIESKTNLRLFNWHSVLYLVTSLDFGQCI